MPPPTVAIARPRLLEPLALAHVAVVEASGGYGKSTLARQLVEELGIAGAMVQLTAGDTDALALLVRLRTALRRAGLSDLATALADPSATPDDLVDDLLQALAREREPVLVVIDDAHHLRDVDARPVIDRLGTGLPEPHRLLVLTRQVREPLTGLAERPETVRLGPADLAFTTDEVVRLVPAASPAAVAGIVRATAGWPAAVTLLGADATSTVDTMPVPDIDRASLLGRLVEDRLASVPPERRPMVRELAGLPLLSPALIAEVSGDDELFDTIVAAGLPIVSGSDGWWRLPDPLRERLAPGRLDPGIARRAAAAYGSRDEIEVAARVLLGAGLADDAAALLADLTPRAMERLDLRTVRGLTRALPEAVASRHPRLWLHLARACDAAADGTTRREALDTVAASLDAQDDAALRRELDAERARDLARDGDVDAAEALARRVLAQAGPGEELTRVRALHTVGRAQAWRAEPASLAEAEMLLGDVIRLYRDLGMPGWSAHAALSLAYHVHHPRGEAVAALDRLDEALAGLAGRPRLRAVLLTFKAEILIANGRSAEAAAPHEEARTIGRALGDRRVLAYVAWNEARAASQAGDPAGTLDRLQETERHPGDWFTHLTGVEFLADAAVLADRVGLQGPASTYLARARHRRTEADQAVMIAEAVTAARSGDPAVAEAAFAALADTRRLETRDRWWLALMRAWAAARHAEPDAEALAAEAFGMAAAIDAALPFIREPEVARALQGRLAGRIPVPEPVLELRLLGASQLLRAGRPVPVPPGRPAAILEMIGIAPAIATDEVIERLWPETDPEIGRARLRNTLNRLRDAVGPVVERHGDELRLAPEVNVDAPRYEAAAREALAELRAAGRTRPGARSDPADRARAIEAARSAMAAYRGPLLPGRAFDDWAAEARERLTRLQLELIDRLGDAATDDGDVDEAIRMRRAGIAVDPDDDARHVALADLLSRQGRRGPARAALDAGVAALRALGLPPTPEMEALRVSIGRASDARRPGSGT